MFRQKRIYFLFFLVLLVALACNMSGGTATPAANGGGQTEPGQSTQVQPTEEGASPSSNNPESNTPSSPQPVVPTAVPSPTSIPSLPVGLRQGLAGLNSYRLQMHIVNNGPKAQDKNEIVSLTEHSKDEDATHIRYETTTSTADSPDPQKSVSEQYTIGSKSCSFTPTDTESPTGTIKENPPDQEALVNSLLNLFDINIFAENPVPAGSETVNGIATNHFTFKVSGIAAVSGAEVTQAQGEYWVAQQGQYLVKYAAIIETRTAPTGDATADVMHLEVQIELKDVDTPIKISMPPDCK